LDLISPVDSLTVTDAMFIPNTDKEIALDDSHVLQYAAFKVSD
jgi:hypothetical protein